MTAILAAGCVLAVLSLAGSAYAAKPADGVPPSRLAVLSRGINLSYEHWHTQVPRTGAGDPPHDFDTPDDVALIQSLGFPHVRWGIGDLAVVKDRDRLRDFDATLNVLLDHGLAVTVDFHASHEFKTAVEKDDAAVENFVHLWSAMAKHLATRDPERVFLEVMNEPAYHNPPRWNKIQKEAIAAMRESARHHTIIACGTVWSEICRLPEIEVVPDPNVVYNFHVYEPVEFTHQQATWALAACRHLKDVPYPSTPEAVAGLLPGVADEEARERLRQYGQDRWDGAKMDTLIAEAAAWGKHHGVPLICNEFGVYRTAPAADRCRWIRDVRGALERYGIGWAMWHYAGSFAVAPGEPGRRAADPAVVKALGLTMPPATRP
jgi:hypothetical protein